MKTMRIGGVIAVLLIAGFIVKILIFPSTHVCASYTSPNGKYRLVGYCRDPLPFIAGGHNDAMGQPGLVRVYDGGGKSYGEAKVPSMLFLQDSSEVVWGEGQVSAGIEPRVSFAIPKE